MKNEIARWNTSDVYSVLLYKHKRELQQVNMCKFWNQIGN